MLNTKRLRFPGDVILVCIRWYVAYPLRYRHLEEIMAERGVSVDHASINRWAVCFLAQRERNSRKYKKPVADSWRMDEMDIRVKGVWKFLYRAVDKAMQENGIPEKVTMDKSGANKAAIDEINANRTAPIRVRQITYRNNIVEQDHRTIKRVTWPMRNSNPFIRPKTCWRASRSCT